MAADTSQNVWSISDIRARPDLAEWIDQLDADKIRSQDEGELAKAGNVAIAAILREDTTTLRALHAKGYSFDSEILEFDQPITARSYASGTLGSLHVESNATIRELEPLKAQDPPKAPTRPTPPTKPYRF